MVTVEQLEHRLQVMQEHVERAYLSGNRLLIVMAEADERNAARALHEERLKRGDY